MHFSWSAFRDAHPTSRKVFILGMGRSGTHFLAETLDAHPQITANIEDKLIFPRVTSIAIDPPRERLLLPIVDIAYRVGHARVAPNHMVDKSHPAIWIAERLAERFPRALFIGLTRGPEATIASALRHAGVSGWHDRWRRYPVPNRFLGITHELAEMYESLTRAEQLAYRWQAHRRELDRLRPVLGDRMLLLHYEEVVSEPELRLPQVAGFLRLDTPIAIPDVREDPLNRWETQLDATTLRAIERITR